MRCTGEDADIEGAGVGGSLKYFYLAEFFKNAYNIRYSIAPVNNFSD